MIKIYLRAKTLNKTFLPTLETRDFIKTRTIVVARLGGRTGSNQLDVWRIGKLAKSAKKPMVTDCIDGNYDGIRLPKLNL